MKKIIVFSLALLTAATMSAQKEVLKEAEKAMKSGQSYTEVLKLVEPAKNNSETANNVLVYYLPGKAGIKQFNDLLGKRELKIKFPEDGPVIMADALLGAYENYMKALPLDSLPDLKGKVKPKYSKEMISDIVGHYADFNNAAIDYWNAKRYNDAYKAWDILLNLPSIPAFANEKSLKVMADTLVADIYYNQGLAAWQANEFGNAINSFRNAIKKGYDKPSIYDYGIAVAQSGKDNDALLEFASEGNRLFGAEGTKYLNQIINYYLQTEKYDEALDYLNKAIAEKPDFAQYYALRGIIKDNQKKRDEAIADYQEAIKNDPNNSLALFYLGRALAVKTGELSDNYSKPDFDTYKATTLIPKYKEAVKLLEEAYKLDPNNRTEILKVLKIVYYQMDDAAGLESVKQRQMEE